MIDELTQQQISTITLKKRPLIICDVDEVVLKFVEALETFLEERNHWLDVKSFALTGNIKSKGTNEPSTQLEVSTFLIQFFAEATGSLNPVNNAPETINSLAELCDIVFLTNIPHQYRSNRIKNLSKLGIDFPVITNSGEKLPAIESISHQLTAGRPIFFLDDAPFHVRSALSCHLENFYVIHFIADSRLAKLVEPIPGTGLNTSNWLEVDHFIRKTIDQKEH